MRRGPKPKPKPKPKGGGTGGGWRSALLRRRWRRRQRKVRVAILVVGHARVSKSGDNPYSPTGRMPFGNRKLWRLPTCEGESGGRLVQLRLRA